MQVTGNSFTLEQLIRNGSAPAIYRLSEDLFKALESIYAEKKWFMDVDENDIYCSKDGRFSLVVSGNTVPQSELPDTANYSCKEYWMPVFTYLIGRVRLAELRPDELPGILFNYLQAMFLILRVRLVFVDQEGYYNSAALFDQLPIILDKMVPEYRVLFTRLLTKADKTPGVSDLKRIKTLFMEKVVLRPIDAETPPSVEPAARPGRRSGGRSALQPAVRSALQSGGRPDLQSGVQSALQPGATSMQRGAGYLQNGDFLAAVILAVALTFSAWLWVGH